MLLAEGKITEEVVANIRSWRHSGFSVDQSVRLSSGDGQGVRRLIQYFLRCPFSQARMIEGSCLRGSFGGQVAAGKVIYKSDQKSLRCRDKSFTVYRMRRKRDCLGTLEAVFGVVF